MIRRFIRVTKRVGRVLNYMFDMLIFLSFDSTVIRSVIEVIRRVIRRVMMGMGI